MQFLAQFTEQDYREFVGFTTFAKGRNHRARRNPVRQMVTFLVLCAVLFVFCRIALTWGNSGSAAAGFLDAILEVVSWLLVVMFLLYLVLLLNLKATFKRHEAALQRFPSDSNIWVNEQGITTHSVDGQVQHFFGWSRVDQVLLTDNLYIFITASGIGLLLPKRAVAGYAPQLDSLMAACMQGKPIRQL